ncbi:uncharacterized protein BDZ99DRAFT_36010 [Mytilinidion resinicola]|uniref:Protein kinase domain-containing protein n=1 Tax=Mytilinidion resinicola TaxID=574789 RepID=A0A6A6YMJ1_9PEZI|nr:uncharacterized protein BDZ99DRAFT_36010 [Mytilinidion resinicola]KAF2809758.1 hypothetical protein BDZ99DRAFT_36010 [Mytilinidion resinicola]
MVERAWTEAVILRYLQQSDGFPGRSISKLLGANVPPAGLSSITMEAAIGPTLDSFWDSYLGRPSGYWMPKEFVWHVFLQLGEAIRFIHSMKDFPGLPNVVLIDFGQANHYETEAQNPFRTRPQTAADEIAMLIEDDNGAFFQIVHTLSMSIVDKEESWDWRGFTDLLKGSLEEMFSWYEAPAIAERAKMSQKAKENIIRHLSDVSVVRSVGLSDDEIRNAIVAESEKM